MGEFLKMLGVFLFGAGGLAIINIIQERWKWRADRKAKKEDRVEEKEDKLDEMRKEQQAFFAKQEKFNEELSKRVEVLEDQNAAQNEGMRYVLLDRILYLGKHYINDGAVDFDDRKRLRDMHTSYHSGLGGNGDADNIMDAVDALPLKR